MRTWIIIFLNNNNKPILVKKIIENNCCSKIVQPLLELLCCHTLLQPHSCWDRVQPLPAPHLLMLLNGGELFWSVTTSRTPLSDVVLVARSWLTLFARSTFVSVVHIDTISAARAGIQRWPLPLPSISRLTVSHKYICPESSKVSPVLCLPHHLQPEAKSSVEIVCAAKCGLFMLF